MRKSDVNKANGFTRVLTGGDTPTVFHLDRAEAERAADVYGVPRNQVRRICGGWYFIRPTSKGVSKGVSK